jgi:hypothetical protein
MTISKLLLVLVTSKQSHCGYIRMQINVFNNAVGSGEQCIDLTECPSNLLLAYCMPYILMYELALEMFIYICIGTFGPMALYA